MEGFLLQENVNMFQLQFSHMQTLSTRYLKFRKANLLITSQQCAFKS